MENTISETKNPQGFLLGLSSNPKKDTSLAELLEMLKPQQFWVLNEEEKEQNSLKKLEKIMESDFNLLRICFEDQKTSKEFFETLISALFIPDSDSNVLSPFKFIQMSLKKPPNTLNESKGENQRGPAKRRETLLKILQRVLAIVPLEAWQLAHVYQKLKALCENDEAVPSPGENKLREVQTALEVLQVRFNSRPFISKLPFEANRFSIKAFLHREHHPVLPIFTRKLSPLMTRGRFYRLEMGSNGLSKTE